MVLRVFLEFVEVEIGQLYILTQSLLSSAIQPEHGGAVIAAASDGGVGENQGVITHFGYLLHAEEGRLDQIGFFSQLRLASLFRVVLEINYLDIFLRLDQVLVEADLFLDF